MRHACTCSQPHPHTARSGFTGALVDLKSRLSAAHPCLPPENPGSRWPKMTLGCLRDGRRLTPDQLALLRRLCRCALLEGMVGVRGAGRRRRRRCLRFFALSRARMLVLMLAHCPGLFLCLAVRRAPSSSSTWPAATRQRRQQQQRRRRQQPAATARCAWRWTARR